MRTYHLRNSDSNQMRRMSDAIQKMKEPARRAGIATLGAFGNLIAPGGPNLITLAWFKSLAAMEEVEARLSQDAAYQKAASELHSGPGLPYMRVESSLLRCFDTVPGLNVPPQEGRSSPRVFEIRTYESDTSATLRTKIDMFEKGEIDIFKRLGMQVIFFAYTIVGRNMPNLVYMLGYDSLAHREKTWQAFAADPEWKKMRSNPEWSDAKIVSNISNVMLRPMPFSDIR